MEQDNATPIGRFDYVIVGAGAAGCVLAYRLSADPSVKVLLLEAGSSKSHFWVKIPLGLYKTIGHAATDWRYKTEPEPALNGRRIPIPRGFGLGGSTLINGMVYIRGQSQDYDRWRDLGNPGWGFSDLLPLFKRHEDFHGGASEHHGAGGEWHVGDIGSRWEILDRFIEAGRTLGIPHVDDVNIGACHGLGYFHVSSRRGVRVTARSAFLDAVRHRPNLTVLSDAHARRIVLEGRRAVGVEFWRGGRLERADADAEVLVAAGAIASPQLLQASGIGAPAVLAAAGVPVQHALPGVGENLQDHIQTRMVVKVHGVKTINRRARSALGKLGIGLEYFLLHRGPLAASATKLCGFVHSSPEHATPNVQYHVNPMSTKVFAGEVHPFDGVTVSICNLRPTSRGHVRIKAADTREHPAITGNFLSTEADQKVAVDAVKLTRRLWQAAPLQRYRPEEVEPGPGVATDDELLAHARATAMTVFHPVGTCRMGPDTDAVVDARLRVHGLHGLRVIDASIMPTLISGNTSAASVVIGEKGADFILEDRRRSQTAAGATTAAANDRPTESLTA
jgi:choline dehydrogenase